MNTCVYQGTDGSYSHMAAKKWNKAARLIGLETFREVFEAVVTREADCGFIALENTLIGFICENASLFQEYPVEIVEEVYQKIDHCLLSTGKEISLITKVYSHPKALDQCRRFFKAHPWMEKIAHFDTAGSALMLANQNDPTIGAIASRSAGELYGLNVLKENIQDFAENYTKFGCIRRVES